MSNYNAGIAQMQAVTRTAQLVQEAKDDLHTKKVHYSLGNATKQAVDAAEHTLGVARAAYRAAFKAYTNPFGVTKTVS